LTAQVVVVELEIDHVVPEAVGGGTNMSNLCLTCVGCNGFKRWPLGSDPTQRWGGKPLSLRTRKGAA